MLFERGELDVVPVRSGFGRLHWFCLIHLNPARHPKTDLPTDGLDHVVRLRRRHRPNLHSHKSTSRGTLEPIRKRSHFPFRDHGEVFKWRRDPPVSQLQFPVLIILTHAASDACVTGCLPSRTVPVLARQCRAEIRAEGGASLRATPSVKPAPSTHPARVQHSFSRSITTIPPHPLGVPPACIVPT